MKERPRRIEVQEFADDRGRVWPIELEGEARRVYVAGNWDHLGNHIRAWHGHPKEWRVVICINGAAQVAFLNLDDHADAASFNMTVDSAEIVYMPPGWALGWMNTRPLTRLMFLAPAHYAERDDVRLDPSIRDDVWVRP